MEGRARGSGERDGRGASKKTRVERGDAGSIARSETTGEHVRARVGRLSIDCAALD